jgi:hypothetical protein
LQKAVPKAITPNAIPKAIAPKGQREAIAPKGQREAIAPKGQREAIATISISPASLDVLFGHGFCSISIPFWTFANQ